jgi:hypothetical protein
MNRFNKPRFQNVAVKYMSRQGNASVTGNWHFLCQFCHPSYTLIILKPIPENVQFNIKLFRNWIGHNFASRLWELYKGLGQFNTKDIVLQRFLNNTVSSRIGISHVQTYAISEYVEHYFLLNLVLDQTNSTLESNIRMDLPKIRLYSNIFELFPHSFCLYEVCFQKMVLSNVETYRFLTCYGTPRISFYPLVMPFQTDTWIGIACSIIVLVLGLTSKRHVAWCLSPKKVEAFLHCC